jgi:hypothetical protein
MRLLLCRLVQPLRFTFHAMLPVAIPTAIVGPIIRPVGMLINRPFLRVPISPALRPINAFALREWRSFAVFLETRLCPVAAETVPARSIGILTIFLSDSLIGITATAVAVVTIVPISESSIVTTSGTVRPSHAAVEALGAFSAKTLPRFDRTPALAILVGISSPAKGVVRSVVLKTITADIRLARLGTEVESLRSVSGLDILETLFDLAELVTSHGGRRGEASSRRPKNDIFRVYEWISIEQSNEGHVFVAMERLTRIAP